MCHVSLTNEPSLRVIVMNFPVSGQQTRPNIVLLLADDWGFPHATPYGDKVVDSRVFDSVAAEGMLFTKAYSAAPHSSPSRACILTGCYAHRLGEACNLNSYFPRDLTVYPELLEKAGYMTVYWHKGWGPGVFSQTGSSRQADLRMDGQQTAAQTIFCGIR
mgnify:CR=1 FL=1